MIEPTDEMVTAFERDGTGGWGDITDTRAGLATVLAIVARDYCLDRRGHVFHPLARPEPGMCRCRPREGQHEFGVEGCQGFEP